MEEMICTSGIFDGSQEGLSDAELFRSKAHFPFGFPTFSTDSFISPLRTCLHFVHVVYSHFYAVV